MVTGTFQKRILQINPYGKQTLLSNQQTVRQTVRQRYLQLVDSLDITDENVMVLQKKMTYQWQDLGDENRLEQKGWVMGLFCLFVFFG